MENRWGINAFEAMKKSPFARILLIGFLVLLLHIPATMIKSVVQERQTTRNEAVEEVRSKWGRAQTIIGPSITVPFVRKWSEQVKPGETKTHSEIRYATFLPENLRWPGKIDTEVRYRGIFQVPVYRVALTCTGVFARPDLAQRKVEAKDILWDRAYLSTSISDVRAITNQAVLNWKDKTTDFLPGTGEAGRQHPGIHASLKGLLWSESAKFSFNMNLNGSEKVLFAPFGKETRVDLESNWSDPSFQGAWLPSERTVGKQAFKATWIIPYLGRNSPQKWTSAESADASIASSLFGASLISPVDHYRMADRSTKYLTLFLVLTFMTLWLFEALTKIRIHSVQYFLVGAGMCLFYLLELSLAEHVGFAVAYTIASLAIVALISSYCIAVLKSTSRAIIVGTVMTILYGYLYVLLGDQDYALLLGSIGLFVALATIMYMTRKVDWYAAQGWAGTEAR